MQEKPWLITVMHVNSKHNCDNNMAHNGMEIVYIYIHIKVKTNKLCTMIHNVIYQVYEHTQ